MQHVADGIRDTIRMLPLLLVVLAMIEALEHRFSHRLQAAFCRLGTWGPLIGAGIGALPQCGGAIVASELYAARALSLGTLLAVYLATSDEAVPILAANPSKAGVIVPLIATKMAIGMLAGYAVDRVRTHRPAREKSFGDSSPHDDRSVNAPWLAKASCASELSVDCASDLTVDCPSVSATIKPYEAHACLEDTLSIPALLAHSLRRALRIAFILALTTAALDWASEVLAPSAAAAAAVGGTGIQVVASAVFGLIPSCAPSIALTDLFVKGVLGYPALIAGLCANAGSGLIVLFHETDWRTVLRLASVLLLVSCASGIIILLTH